MAAWNNENEMFELMKEKLYTPVVGDILDQMGYKHRCTRGTNKIKKKC